MPVMMQDANCRLLTTSQRDCLSSGHVAGDGR